MAGGAAVGAFIEKAIERFEHFEFALLNAVADLDPSGDAATGRVYIWEIRQDRGTGRWTNAFGVYEDRYVKLGERWVFGQRAYSSLAAPRPTSRSSASAVAQMARSRPSQYGSRSLRL